MIREVVLFLYLKEICILWCPLSIQKACVFTYQLPHSMRGNGTSEGESCTAQLWEDDIIKPHNILVDHTSNFRLTNPCEQFLENVHSPYPWCTERRLKTTNTGTVKWTGVKCLPPRRPISVWFYFCSEFFFYLSEMIVCRLNVFNKSFRDKLAFWFSWKRSGERISIVSDTTVFFFLSVYSTFLQSPQHCLISSWAAE